MLAGCGNAGRRRAGIFLGVPLLDHAEAAELALDAVEVAVVIGVARDEAIAG